MLAYVDAAAGRSPLTSAMARLLAADDELLGLLNHVPDERQRIPNVILAAVHFLMLRSPDASGHELAGWFPTVGGSRLVDDPDLGRALGSFLRSHEEILGLLRTRTTQTNEIGRAAVLRLGIRAVARDRPVALIDVGTSGGVNLHLDRARIDHGIHGTVGPADSPLRLECELRGDIVPDLGSVTIGWRLGLDRDPVDLTDDVAADWTRACIWPDQHARHERFVAARDAVRAAPHTVLKGDLFDTVPAAVAAAPEDLLVVLTHSLVLYYLDAAQRLEFEDLLTELSRRREIGRVGLETDRVIPLTADEEALLGIVGDEASALVASRHVGAARTVVGLGRSDHHGAWISWR